MQLASDYERYRDDLDARGRAEEGCRAAVVRAELRAAEADAARLRAHLDAREARAASEAGGLPMDQNDEAAVSAVIARVEQQMQEERELRQKMAAAEAAERLRNAQSEAFYAAIIFAERDDECAFRLHEALNFETLHEDVCRFFECETPPIPSPAQFSAQFCAIL